MLLWVCAGCNLHNPAEPVPAYLQLKAPLVFSGTDTLLIDTVSENITNTWLYVDGTPLGVFNRTATVPVIGEGQKSIVCLPGVMENGVAAYRVIYPFYRADTVAATLTPNGDVTVNPRYRYFSGVEIPMNEDFEIGSLFEPTVNSTALLDTVSGSNGFQGSSGKITLADTSAVFEYRTIDSYPLSADDGSIYLEMNYKTDATIQVGLFQESSGSTYFGWNLNPKDQWNKVYFNLMDAVTSSGGGNYKIVLRAEKPAGVSVANVFLDNVKLVHF